MIRRALLGTAMCVCAIAITGARQPARSDRVAVSVAAYAAGNWDEAVRIGQVRGLTTGDLLDGLERWVRLDQKSEINDRRLMACAFALDAVWTSTRGPLNGLRANADPWGRVKPDQPDHVSLSSFVSEGLVASWVAKAVRDAPHRPKTAELERLLLLSAIAVASDGSAWHRLREEVLPIAANRLPDEPRLAFAETLSRVLPELGPLRNSDLFHRGDVLHHDALSASVRKKIPDAVAALDRIRSVPSLAWEVDLWAGYLYLRADDWNRSVARLERAGAGAAEPVAIALVNYLSGWVLEQRGETTDAIAAYRRALTAMPLQEEVSWRLAALLYLSNQREEAYALLGPISAPHTAAPPSLLLTLERGDGRFAADLLAALRKALP